MQHTGSTWCRSLVPQIIILNTLDPHSLDPGQRLKTLSYIQQTSCVKIGLCQFGVRSFVQSHAPNVWTQ